MARNGGGRKPKKPAASKRGKARPKPADPLSPQAIKDTVLAYAAIAWAYQHQGTWNEASALRQADESLLRKVAQLVQKHRFKTPPPNRAKAAKEPRLNEHTLRLGYLRWDFERILESFLEGASLPDRDQRIESRLRAALEERGVSVTPQVLGGVLLPLIREDWDADGRPRKDWVRGDNGVRNTAGRILERLGVRLGWLGSSGGNTDRLRSIVETADEEFKNRTADQLQISAFLLATLGVPPKTLPWVSFLVFLATKGADLALVSGDLPPWLPQHPRDLKAIGPAPFLDMSQEEFEQGFRHAWESLASLRTDLRTRFPHAELPSDSGWKLLWQHLSYATLPLPMALGALDSVTDDAEDQPTASADGDADQ